MKHKTLILLLATLSFTMNFSFSCKHENNNNNNKTINKSKNESNNEDASIQYYKNIDSIVNKICDTTYKISYSKIVNLKTEKLNFKPVMLVVSKSNLFLLDSSFKSIYKIPLPLDVFSATWSQKNKNLIYILLKQLKKNKKEQNYYDLIFCKLNLDSMNLEEITKLYDYSEPLSKLQYEIYDFFPINKLIYIDENKQKFYIDCVDFIADMDDYKDVTYFATYTIDLKNKKVTLSKNESKSNDKNLGKALKIYNDFSTIFSNKYVKIFDIENIKDTIYLTKKYFYSVDSVIDNTEADGKKIDEYKKDSTYKNFSVDLCFSPNNKFILVSPYAEGSMFEFYGNTYLQQKDSSNYRLLFKSVVMSNYYNSFSIYSVFDTLITIQYDDNLFLFDQNFNLIKKFDNFDLYEIKN